MKVEGGRSNGPKALHAAQAPTGGPHSQALGDYTSSKVVFRNTPAPTKATFAAIDEANRTRWVYEWERENRKEREERCAAV